MPFSQSLKYSSTDGTCKLSPVTFSETKRAETKRLIAIHGLRGLETITATIETTAPPLASYVTSATGKNWPVTFFYGNAK